MFSLFSLTLKWKEKLLKAANVLHMILDSKLTIDIDTMTSYRKLPSCIISPYIDTYPTNTSKNTVVISVSNVEKLLIRKNFEGAYRRIINEPEPSSLLQEAYFAFFASRYGIFKYGIDEEYLTKYNIITLAKYARAALEEALYNIYVIQCSKMPILQCQKNDGTIAAVESSDVKTLDTLILNDIKDTILYPLYFAGTFNELYAYEGELLYEDEWESSTDHESSLYASLSTIFL